MGRASRLVTGLLVIIFCMSAIVKLTNKFDPKAHEFMKREFRRFAKVNIVTQVLKIKVDAFQFMRIFAFIEGFIGLFILTGPTGLSMFASIMGILLQSSVIQMMYLLKNPPFTFIPASVAIGLLLLNIVILATSSSDDQPQRVKKTQ